MKRHFNTHIEGLDLPFWHSLIERHGRRITYRAGESICLKGEPTNALGYVISGYLLYEIVSEKGRKAIGGFAFPEAMFGDYPSCMTNSPALFNITAGKKTEVWLMDATLLPSLYATDTAMSRQGRLFMEAAYRSLCQRYYALYSQSPAERYITLIEEHPQILQLPQKEIAAYLQISPIHLCRIRKALLR